MDVVYFNDGIDIFLFWERPTGGTVSFGDLSPPVRCRCDKCEVNTSGIIHDMSNLIIPPSPNWFQHNGVSLRQEDRILAASCFKNIVIYNIPQKKRTPKVMKLIMHTPGKVNGVSLHPNSLNHDFGHTIAAIGDQSTLSLFNIHNGSLLAQHKVPKVNFNSLCWGRIREEDILAAVGENGSLIIWQPKYLIAKSHTLEPKKNLSVIEVLPKEKNKAIIASDKTLLLVCLMSGDILSQYKGHDHPVYSIRFYPGTKNIQEIGALPTNTRWQRDNDTKESPTSSEKEEEVTGPFFASSDLGRGVFVWDLTAKRFLAKAVAPFTANSSKKFQFRGSQSKNHHISFNWTDSTLYSSTVTGEVIEWNLQFPEMKYRLLNHTHSRVIYNMEIIDNNLMITFSQDRLILGFDLENCFKSFLLNTIGICANSMAFSPHDASRLAIGMQDESIKLLTFNADTGQKLMNISQNIKGRVLSVAWHPVQEGKVLFGTSEGQVGVADVFSCRTSTFAYFHQKSVYKVEWGKAFASDKTGMKEDWYAYSFGDRELLARNPANFMEDPTWLDNYLGMEKGLKSSFSVSEFSFSPDYKYIALGSINGDIKIFDRLTAKCMAVISRVRKVIQHLLWKPPSIQGTSYTLGVASAENFIYIFELDHVLADIDSVSEPLILTQPTKELCAHAGRVIWLSWSPHQDNLLASASYDHTVQVWNTSTGEPLKNYGGHSHRVFRCEFSPSDPDTVISFAEENCIHEWKISQITTRTPAESVAILKENKKKIKTNVAEEAEERELSSTKLERELVNKAKSNADPVSSTVKKVAKKSSFPLFHSYSTRKKNFHHMCLLSLMESELAKKKETNDNQEKKLQLSEELEDEEELEVSPNVNGMLNQRAEMEKYARSAISNHSNLMPPELPLPEVNDIVNFLSYFGSTPEVDSAVNEEIKTHVANENQEQSNLMHCWRGSLESQIKWAAKHKCLDSFLVSMAPQVSFSLWENACEAYAEQLAENGETAMAATYLTSIHKDEEAIDLLIKHKFFKEALIIAKYKLGFNAEVIEKVLNSWANMCIFEGNFELAAVIQQSGGNIQLAAKTLARRTESRSLVIAAQLFLASNCFELANSTAVLSFKGSSSKNEFEKFEPVLKQMPHLKWCKVINVCQMSLWNFIGKHQKWLAGQVVFSDPGEDISEDQPLMNGGSCEDSFVKSVLLQWEEMDVVPSNYSKYSKEIKDNMSTQSPVTLKNLWFLISISITEMLLDGRCEGEVSGKWEDALDSVLKNLSFWGKVDQTYYLTHILLPKGIKEPSTLELPAEKLENSDAVKQLISKYISSEVASLCSLLETEPHLLPWKGKDMGKCNGESSNGVLKGSTDEKHGENGSVESELKEGESVPSSEECSGTYKGDTYNLKKYIPLYDNKEQFIRAIESFIEELKVSSCESSVRNETLSYINKVLLSLRERSVLCPKLLAALLAKTN